MKKAWMAVVVGACLLVTAGAGLAGVVWAADDDLAVVRRAVAVADADEKAKEKDERPAGPAVRKSSRRPTWLKVSIVEEKDGKKEARVSVTVPLALLSVLGKDASVDLAQLGVKGLKDHQQNVRIMDVLETLEPGTMLVEVQEEKEHIKVWVE